MSMLGKGTVDLDVSGDSEERVQTCISLMSRFEGQIARLPLCLTRLLLACYIRARHGSLQCFLVEAGYHLNRLEIC